MKNTSRYKRDDRLAQRTWLNNDLFSNLFAIPKVLVLVAAREREREDGEGRREGQQPRVHVCRNVP